MTCSHAYGLAVDDLMVYLLLSQCPLTSSFSSIIVHSVHRSGPQNSLTHLPRDMSTIIVNNSAVNDIVHEMVINVSATLQDL